MNDPSGEFDRTKYPVFIELMDQYQSAYNPYTVELRQRAMRGDDRSRAFRAEFEAIMRDETFTRWEFEKLTCTEWDTEEEHRRWLACLHSFLFEGGPNPESLVNELFLVPDFDLDALRERLDRCRDQPWIGLVQEQLRGFIEAYPEIEPQQRWRMGKKYTTELETVDSLKRIWGELYGPWKSRGG